MGLCKNTMDIVQDYVHQLRFAPCLRQITDRYEAHCQYVDTIVEMVQFGAGWINSDFAQEFLFDILEDIELWLLQDWFRNGQRLRSTRKVDGPYLPSHARAAHDCYTRSAVVWLLENFTDDEFAFFELGADVREELHDRKVAAIKARTRMMCRTRVNWFPKRP